MPQIIFLIDVLVEEPSSVMVPINSIATFYCAVAEQDMYTIKWNARTSDGIDFTLPDDLDYVPGNPNITTVDGTRVKLSIQGLAENNSSEIKCTARGVSFHQSDPALLTVYGKRLLLQIETIFHAGPPNPPGNLRATPLSHLTLNVSWSEAFFPYDTIPLSYQLQIFNEGSTLTKEQQLDSNTTYYILHITSEEEICKIYTFKLRSLNDAGYSSEVTTAGLIPHGKLTKVALCT